MAQIWWLALVTGKSWGNNRVAHPCWSDRSKVDVDDPYLECKEEEECLYWVESPIHKVSHEEVIGSRAVSTNFEQLHHVIELPMDIAT